MTCNAGAACVSLPALSTVGKARAQCAFSAAKDARCAPEGPSEYCEGTTAVGCEAGFATWRADCSTSACDPNARYGTGCAGNAPGARTTAGRSGG